jgi:glycosyltransferase involved in cell wall biosynthesis
VIRVTIVQPSLAPFRVPAFARLAATPDLKLNVIYSDTGRSNATPIGFDARHEPINIRRVAGHPVYWYPAQIEQANIDLNDVLVLTWDAHYLSLYPALLKARRDGVGTVVWGHGYSRHTSASRRLPRQAIAKLADAVVFYNETGRQRYVDAGFDPAKLFVAYNAVDRAQIDQAILHYHAAPHELLAFRQANGIDGKPLVLFVARLSPERRVDLLIDAAARLRDAGRSFQVVIVGAGDEPFIATLREQIASRRLDGVVRLVGPCYDEIALAGWFLSARVFAFPSYMGLSLHHAFAYAVPVVTTDRDEHNGPEIEALVSGVNGMKYRDGDPDSLANAIDDYLSNESLARSHGRSGRAVIDATFSIPRLVEGLKSAINFAASARKN